MPRPTALDAARSFRAALANDEAQAAGRMATIYNRIYTGLQGDLAKLSVDISAMDSPSRGAIMKLARMQSIQQQVKEQVTKFGGAVQNEVTIVQSQAVQAGIDNALTLIDASLPPLPDAVRGQLVASFARLPADAVEAAAGLTGQDSPLNERLSDLYGEYVAEQVGNHITDGIAKGDNPRTIARQLEKNVLNGLGSGLTSALTTVRTAQIKSYQLANHATYLANDNIVKGWVWHAELGTACLACTAEHGTIHPLEETLDGHHNCRCAPIPQTITYEELGLDIPETVEPVQSGEDWFNEQSAATQRELMGPAKYDAWKEGKFEFGQLSTRYNDPVYGELAREATLKELTEGGAGVPKAPEPGRAWDTEQAQKEFEEAINFSDKKQTFSEQAAPMAKWLEKYSEAAGPYNRHGMSSEENGRRVVWNGIPITFPDTPAGRAAAAGDLRTMARPPRFSGEIEFPERLIDATQGIFHTSQKNKSDDFWAEVYNTPDFTSVATAGDGFIVVYNDGHLNRGSFAHESGHNLATVLWGGTEPPADSVFGQLWDAWKQGVSDAESPVTDYARNSRSEDFAEAVDMFVTENKYMNERYPHRYQAMYDILIKGKGG